MFNNSKVRDNILNHVFADSLGMIQNKQIGFYYCYLLLFAIFFKGLDLMIFHDLVCEMIFIIDFICSQNF